MSAGCARSPSAGGSVAWPGADAARLARQDADDATARLTKAIAAGFRDAATLKMDADLDALRNRDDFKKLLAELQKNDDKK